MNSSISVGKMMYTKMLFQFMYVYIIIRCRIIDTLLAVYIMLYIFLISFNRILITRNRQFQCLRREANILITKCILYDFHFSNLYHITFFFNELYVYSLHKIKFLVNLSTALVLQLVLLSEQYQSRIKYLLKI